MDPESRAIRLPIPGVGKVLCFGMLAVLAWIIWSADLDSASNPHQKKREKLWSPDATAIERIQAVEEWADQGEYAIPELTRALGSSHDNVRATAVLALSRIGPLAQGCVPQLYSMLKDPSDTVRANVIHALLQIGYKLPEAVPALVECLNDPVENVRSCAEEALMQIGRPAVIPVCEYLREHQGLGRRHGLTILMKLQMEHEQIAEVARLGLNDENSEVQARSLAILTFLDVYTVDEIVPHLDSRSEQVQLLVLRALEHRPTEIGRFVPQLVALLIKNRSLDDSARARVDEQVLQTFAAMGPLAADALPAIAELWQHPHPRYRAAAVRAASSIAVNDETFRRIAEMIATDPSPVAVSAAGEALAKAYPGRVAEIFGPLRARLASGRPDQVMLAASAVYGIGPAAAPLTPSLDDCLEDPDIPRGIVVLALGKIGDAAQPAIPNLIMLMELEELQSSIFWALGRITPRPHQIPAIEKHVRVSLEETRGSMLIGIATMRSTLAEDRVRKRVYAFEMLGALAGKRESIAELLLDNLSEPDSSVRWTVLWGLTNLKGREEEVVPLLIEAIGDSSRYVQATVLLGLGKIGQQPELCVPLLMDYLHDPDPYLKTAAALSLASFPDYTEPAREELELLIADEANAIQNTDRLQQAFWEVRRLPEHLKPLQEHSVKTAAEHALAAGKEKDEG